MAGAALSQSQVQISWQAQRFREVVAGAAHSHGQVQISHRRGAFARSSTIFGAGAALSQGLVKIPWHAQNFRRLDREKCGTWKDTLKDRDGR